MLPGQEAVISALVGAKLHVRRLLRHGRANGRAERARLARAGFLDAGAAAGTDADARTGHSSKARGARLPACPPDDVPVQAAAVAAGLFLLAFAVRAWRVAEPASVVFDELHFNKFAKSYWTGEYAFDIHPPLGKLNLYAVSRLFSSRPMQTNSSRIGQAYDPVADAAYIPMRLSSAVFGASLPPLTFLIGRELGFAAHAALAPAFAQAVDSLVVIESRLILMDAQLSTFIAACLLCALRLWGAPKYSRRRVAYLVATAVFGALALSVKWTALATPALVAIVSLAGVPFPRDGARLDVWEMIVAGAIGVALYVLFFYVHFALLPRSGRGDKFMTDLFQSTLIGSDKFDAKAVRPSFLRSFAYLNARMLSASAHIKTRHRWESKWYQWIISQRGVLYHHRQHHGDVAGASSKVYLTVNLAVCYGALVAVVAFVVFFAAVYVPRLRANRLSAYDKHHGFVGRGLFLLAGYLTNMVPCVWRSRALGPWSASSGSGVPPDS
jgi:dolichyl-phosphate-mannose--protein O-mannosyl transferase